MTSSSEYLLDLVNADFTDPAVGLCTLESS
jgi:hypothetical protein